MKHIVSIALFVLLGLSGRAQYGFDVSRDEQSGQTMFVGRCTFDDLSEEASFDWITLGSNSYNPEPLITDQLKKVLPSCEIIIFMGTWCEDTHKILPKLYKTMLLSRCYTNYKMYALDRSKHSKDGEERQYQVSLLPTIIVMKNGTELGRIIEAPKTTIESDLLKIALGEGK